MSSSASTSTKRASSSKSATATTSTSTRSSLPLSSSESHAPSDSTTRFIPTQTITNPVPTRSDAAPIGNRSDASAPPVAAIVVLVLVLLGLVSAGVTFFLCKRKKRKQRSAEDHHILNHEPKRRDSYPQPSIADVPPYSPKARDDYDDDIKSPISSLDGSLDLASRAKPRTSRASSSIFVPEDTRTIASRSHFLRPISLGEPIGLKSMQLSAGQMPALPESPLQPNTNMEQRADPATPKSSGSFERADDDKRSLHTFTVTRPTTPEVPPLPPIPAQLPAPPLLPPIRTSLFNGRERRDSSNTLAPSRYDISSRPQSMISVYSTRTYQTEAYVTSPTLSPDVAEVLTRLKKRISTPWSINSISTTRAERMSVTRASQEG